MLFLNSWKVGVVPYYVTTHPPAIRKLQLFENSTGTQEKLRLNLHSLSVSELLEYGRKPLVYFIDPLDTICFVTKIVGISRIEEYETVRLKYILSRLVCLMDER
jgi:hypothetical protein